VVVEADGGKQKEWPLALVVDVRFPNAMSVPAKTGYYLGRIWEFVADEPRESNTEGGVFPAIFGTVMMVFLMSIIVTPLGVLAAFYLREYARQGPFVSAVRIAVNNLAGVPSIVFGVFGVGFFIYFVGGSIDRIFFPEALPTPTYGTGGILWASLTLALLTVPVVIVATEEGLAAIPLGIREASLALSATKLETTLRVVLPAVMPSILTGLILAMARAAGEVAPHDHRGGQAGTGPCLWMGPGHSCTWTASSCISASTSTTWASSRPTWTRPGRWCSPPPCCCS
jgi:phosphate transport system permease protein